MRGAQPLCRADCGQRSCLSVVWRHQDRMLPAFRGLLFLVAQKSRGANRPVMGGAVRRSAVMGNTVALALPTPDVASLQFDALYRSSASDVFAYVASLLHDRAAAEDVTAQAFERAYRRRASFDARRGSA